jgi:nucleoside-diphosphate-sugar epimerase
MILVTGGLGLIGSHARALLASRDGIAHAPDLGRGPAKPTKGLR